jgi:hypothetical protein
MRPIVELDTGIRIAIRLCRKELVTGRGELWRVYRGRDQGEHLTLLCLMNEQSDSVAKHYLVGPINHLSTEFAVRIDDRLLESGARLRDLSEFYESAVFLSHLMKIGISPSRRGKGTDA